MRRRAKAELAQIRGTLAATLESVGYAGAADGERRTPRPDVPRVRKLRLGLVFAAAAILLVGSMIVVYRVGFIRIHAQEKMSRQLIVLQQLGDVLSALKDTETGHRGYLLTGTESKTEQFTIHQDPPVILPLDAGDAGTSVGDAFYFHADLRSAPAGPVVGEVFGTKLVVKTATAQHPQVEQRFTDLVFTFNDRQDQIVVAGIADYPVAGAEFDPDQPVVRAIVGGTGVFIGASGEFVQHPASGGRLHAGVRPDRVIVLDIRRRRGPAATRRRAWH